MALPMVRGKIYRISLATGLVKKFNDLYRHCYYYTLIFRNESFRYNTEGDASITKFKRNLVYVDYHLLRVGEGCFYVAFAGDLEAKKRYFSGFAESEFNVKVKIEPYYPPQTELYCSYDHLLF